MLHFLADDRPVSSWLWRDHKVRSGGVCEWTGSMSAKLDVVLPVISEGRPKTSSSDNKPDFRLLILSLLDSLCHGVAIALAIYLWWDCFQEDQEYKLRSWHGPVFTVAVRGAFVSRYIAINFISI